MSPSSVQGPIMAGALVRPQLCFILPLPVGVSLGVQRLVTTASSGVTPVTSARTSTGRCFFSTSKRTTPCWLVSACTKHTHKRWPRVTEIREMLCLMRAAMSRQSCVRSTVAGAVMPRCNAVHGRHGQQTSMHALGVHTARSC